MNVCQLGGDGTDEERSLGEFEERKQRRWNGE